MVLGFTAIPVPSSLPPPLPSPYRPPSSPSSPSLTTTTTHWLFSQRHSRAVQTLDVALFLSSLALSGSCVWCATSRGAWHAKSRWGAEFFPCGSARCICGMPWNVQAMTAGAYRNPSDEFGQLRQAKRISLVHKNAESFAQLHQRGDMRLIGKSPKQGLIQDTKSLVIWSKGGFIHLTSHTSCVFAVVRLVPWNYHLLTS